MVARKSACEVIAFPAQGRADRGEAEIVEDTTSARRQECEIMIAEAIERLRASCSALAQHVGDQAQGSAQEAEMGLRHFELHFRTMVSMAFVGSSEVSPKA